MSLAREDSLLLACSRVNLGDQAIGIASGLLEFDLDWNYIMEASIAHGVAPLFYNGLRQLGPAADRIPARFAQELAILYRGNQVRNRRLYGVLGEIARQFERAGIDVMGLKDAQLCREVYPDIGLRPIGDIDLLIHRKDYETAALSLSALGFHPMPGPDIPFTLKYAWALHFRRPEDEVWVDLQWNVVQREWDVCGEGNFDFEIERMWQGAGHMRLDACHILVPKPEDMLFHLCLHLEGHYFSELILFCDIAEHIKHYGSQLDWAYFIDITRKYKAQSSVYYILLLVQRWLGTPLPEHLLPELEPAYFQGNLYRPLYENLTLLHHSLDEIRSDAWPPPETMAEFEKVVRRQAHGVMQTFKECDAIASSFIRSGGALVIPEGSPSDKYYPESALAAMNDIDFLILPGDLGLLINTLVERGFKRAINNGSEVFAREWLANSADPALDGHPTRMEVQVTIEHEVARLFEDAAKPSASKKDAAVKSIKAKMFGGRRDPTRFPIGLKVVPLSPEDLLMFTRVRLGKQNAEGLFRICSLLEFFRGYDGPINWGRLASEAERYGQCQSVRNGLLLVGDLVEEGRVPPNPIPSTEPDSPPRLFEWARYDTAVWGRYSNFKPAFHFLFSLLSIQGTSARIKYLSRSMFGDNGTKAFLPDLIFESAESFLLKARSQPPSARDFAYWIEPVSHESV